jgi:hypothetical protein
VIEFIQYFVEVPHRPGDPVRGPDQHHLETAAAGIAKQVIETRPASLSSRDSVGILGNDLKTPLLGHRAQIVELGLRVLVHSGYAQIQSNSFHN